MIQHFYGNNFSTLCCNYKDIDERFDQLSLNDINDLKKLPTIIKYFNKINENIDNISLAKFKKIIVELLKKFQHAMDGFFTVLKCLHSLTFSLPGSPLGKQVLN